MYHYHNMHITACCSTTRHLNVWYTIQFDIIKPSNMTVQTRWLYCVECPQYSIRLEAPAYLCASCLFPEFNAASVTWLNSRSSLAASDWLLSAIVAELLTCIRHRRKFGGGFLFQKNSLPHRSTFVFKFCEIWQMGHQQKRALLTWVPDKKNSPGSPAFATAWIVHKICQGQPQTMYSECSRFHPNWFTFGRVISECVNSERARKWIQYSAKA